MHVETIQDSILINSIAKKMSCEGFCITEFRFLYIKYSKQSFYMLKENILNDISYSTDCMEVATVSHKSNDENVKENKLNICIKI